jgi:DnaA family protein
MAGHREEALLAAGQLSLPVSLADDSRLENFYVRPGTEVVFDAAAGASHDPVNYLHGGAEVGKSHLLQALCHHHPGAIYLPLSELLEFAPEAVFADLEGLPLLALDDLQLIAGRAPWEEGLFHLLNRARAAGCPLWFAATKPPSGLGIALADLSSRLAGGLLWSLASPSDEDKQAILRFRAGRRGLALSAPVSAYIVSRGSRSLSSLLALLDDLDEASLRLKRPLTIPLVREVMGW